MRSGRLPITNTSIRKRHSTNRVPILRVTLLPPRPFQHPCFCGVSADLFSIDLIAETLEQFSRCTSQIIESVVVKLHLGGMEKRDKLYRALLEEYRVALGFLSGMRTLYSAISPKVVSAREHVAKLEEALASHGAYQRPFVADGSEPAMSGLESTIT